MGSQIFKALIMTVIITNAIILAVETGDLDEYYITLFDILDMFFLSVYFTGKTKQYLEQHWCP